MRAMDDALQHCEAARRLLRDGRSDAHQQGDDQNREYANPLHEPSLRDGSKHTRARCKLVVFVFVFGFDVGSGSSSVGIVSSRSPAGDRSLAHEANTINEYEYDLSVP